MIEEIDEIEYWVRRFQASQAIPQRTVKQQASLSSETPIGEGSKSSETPSATFATSLESAYRSETSPETPQASTPTVLPDQQAELAWRIAAMRSQVRPRPLHQPLLVARSDAPLLRDAPGRCGSCGEPRHERDGGGRYTCGYCARAKEAVLNEAYEGVTLLTAPVASRETPATPQAQPPAREPIGGEGRTPGSAA